MYICTSTYAGSALRQVVLALLEGGQLLTSLKPRIHRANMYSAGKVYVVLSTCIA